ncbi:MAG TPA: DCC1-like thiol-disulfide oxidoreductase family protein [Gemmatimonadaceae bacterium]|nr:DCC1-like thiol-disulfide oxidoreductase family protein [Gemmatimonadaceae bacterium]
MRHDTAFGSAVTAEAPVLLYDGVCALCNGAVRFVLGHERNGTIRFASLDGAYARRLLQRHPALREVDSLIFVEPGSPRERVSVRSEAILRVSRCMGWPWRGAAWLRILPRAVRDAGYDLVSRSRYRVFGKLRECPVPAPEWRARFID